MRKGQAERTISAELLIGGYLGFAWDTAHKIAKTLKKMADTELEPEGRQRQGFIAAVFGHRVSKSRAALPGRTA